MIKLAKIGYNLQDVSIVPASITEINSRKEVNPYTNICNCEVYPIFVAPMASLTDEHNYKVWIENKVIPVVPRSVAFKINDNGNVISNLTLEERLNIAEETFVSLSLTEAEEFLEYEDTGFEKKYICIDIANGHMQKLLDISKRIKDCYGERVEIMVGNIANPKIYSNLCEACVDWVRCNIGSGSACVTSCATGVYMPSATLLDELVEEKNKYVKFEKECDCPYTKIIFDGGVRWYDDISKALALGADAIMIGKLFAECEEACGEIGYAENEDAYIKGEIYEEEAFVYQTTTLKPYRLYSGMSHRSMQKITGGDGSKVSEGICIPVQVKYPVSHWINNMDSYLRSAMSYTNSRTLDEFKKAEMVVLGGSGAVYRK